MPLTVLRRSPSSEHCAWAHSESEEHISRNCSTVRVSLQSSSVEFQLLSIVDTPAMNDHRLQSIQPCLIKLIADWMEDGWHTLSLDKTATSDCAKAGRENDWCGYCETRWRDSPNMHADEILNVCALKSSLKSPAVAREGHDAVRCP